MFENFPETSHIIHSELIQQVCLQVCHISSSTEHKISVILEASAVLSELATEI